MKVLVTGASGFVGGRISEFLQKKNLTLIKTSRKKIPSFKKINWKSNNSLDNLLNNTDVVINCIGADVHCSNNLKKAKLLNITYPKKIYKAAIRNNVKLFIYISTYHVYDFDKKIINEKSKIKIKDNHTKSKILGEKELKKISKNETKLLIIRSCNLFGKAKFKNKNSEKLLIISLIKNVLKRKKFLINSNKNNLRYYSSLENFCNFIYKCILQIPSFKKKSKIVNFTSNYQFTIIKLTNYLNRFIYLKKKIESKIVFKHKHLKKVNNFIFKSNFQKKLGLINDKYFKKEILRLISDV